MYKASQKVSILRLKIRLLLNRLIILLRANLFFIALSFIILSFTLFNWYFVFCYLVYLFIIFKKNRYLFLITIILNIIFILIYLFTSIYLSSQNPNTTGIVISVIKKDSLNKITIINGLKKIIIYDSDKLNINISDKLIVNGTIKNVTGCHNEFDYNEIEYLKGLRVSSIIYPEKLEIKESINIFTLRKYIYKYVDCFFKDTENSKAYIKALILGDTQDILDSDLENIKINNISHLFAISGMHIGILVKILEKMLLKKSDNTKYKVISVFLIVYSYISNFSPSVIRASMLYIISNYSKRKGLFFSSLDALSLIFIMLLIVNPFYIYNLSFKLSFFASLVIILASDLLNKLKKYLNTVLELILITLILQVISFGVTVNINNSVNITSIITNSVFIIYVSMVMLPASLISFFVFPLKYVLELSINLFTFLNNNISKYLKLVINFPSMERYEIFIFYLLLGLIFFSINKKKIYKNIYLYLMIIFMFGYYNKAYLNINGSVSVLDLYEGDSIIIDYPFDGGIVIIDTGTGRSDFLKKHLIKKGIRKIDLLILTHNHNDHNGEAESIINSFRVREVVTSIYDDSMLKSKKVKEKDTIIVKEHIYTFLNPDNFSENTNDNSLVFVTKIENLNYLFLGDVSKDIEVKIKEKIEKLNIDIDVVKVAHHGSNTSTSPVLYSFIKPKLALISVGTSRSKYFPSKDVLETLSSTTKSILRTDIDYEIIIYFNKHRNKIKTLNNKK